MKMVMLRMMMMYMVTFAGRRSVISISSNLCVSTSFWWIAIRRSWKWWKWISIQWWWHWSAIFFIVMLFESKIENCSETWFNVFFSSSAPPSCRWSSSTCRATESNIFRDCASFHLLNNSHLLVTNVTMLLIAQMKALLSEWGLTVAKNMNLILEKQVFLLRNYASILIHNAVASTFTWNFWAGRGFLKWTKFPPCSLQSLKRKEMTQQHWCIELSLSWCKELSAADGAKVS